MSRLTPRWQGIHLAMAKTLAKEASKDASTQVGALVVRGKEFISFGYNGFPASIPDDDDILRNPARRDEKLALMVHAEANAIMRSGGASDSPTDLTLVVTHHPCSSCAKTIANSGIHTVYYEVNEDLETRWAEDIKLSRMIMDKAGITYYGI